MSERTLVAFDTETHLIQPGLGAPPLVCASVADEFRGPRLLSAEDARIELPIILSDSRCTIVGANIAYDFGVMVADVYRCSRSRGDDLLGLVFAAYDAGRVFDIQIAQALDAIARGILERDPESGGPLRDPVSGKPSRYSLAVCVYQMLGRTDAKANDFWRLRYALLEDIPLDQWPEEARQYPKDDAQNTLEVARAQVYGGPLNQGPVKGPLKNLHDVPNQCRAAWALWLAALQGVRTDREAVEALEAKALEQQRDAIERFSGVFLREDGTEDQAAVKRAMAKAYGASGPCSTCAGTCKVPSEKTGKPVNCKRCDGTGLDLDSAPLLKRTDKGGVAKDRDAKTESGDDVLAEYAEESGSKTLGTYLPWLKNGTDTPIILRPNPVLETGRVSYDGVVQLFPRDGDERQCVIPPRGFYYCSIDFSAVELCTLAEACIQIVGKSALGDAINAGKDPHSMMGANLIGIGYDEFIERKAELKGIRQAAKPCNFGFPGGMGTAKFVITNRKANAGSTTAPDGKKYAGIRFCILLDGAERCGVNRTEWNDRPTAPICSACATIVEKRLKPTWFETFPEVRQYFRHTAQLAEGDGTMTTLVSERIRGGGNFTSISNGYFQSLAADGGKAALWEVTKECYLDRSSPMYGSRPAAWIHDEILAHVPIEGASDAALRMAEVMVAAMQKFTPHVKIKAEPALMKRWYKGAEAKWESGVLVPWEPAALAA